MASGGTIVVPNLQGRRSVGKKVQNSQHFLSKIVGGSKKIVFYFLGFLSLVKLKEDATLERQGA